MIAAVAFSVYYVSSHFFAGMLPYVFVAGAIVAPWVLIRSAAFNARYSSFRNMTFRFNGKYLAALKAIYALGIIPALLILVALVFGEQWQYVAAVPAIAFIIFGLSFPWWVKRVKSYIIGHTSYGSREGNLSATGGQFFKVYLSAFLILLGIVFISGIIIAAMTFLFKNASPMLFFFTMVPMYAGYVLAFAYVKAHGTNLVWNHTQMGPLRFRSTLTAGGMTKLYVTNALAILASAGLMTPWAVIRTLKYRADNLRVLLEGDFTDFSGSAAGTVQAAGAEIGDFFDMDLSL